jgi:WD40 repeat protein
MEFTRDGQKLFTLSPDNTIQIWDVATSEHLRTLRLPWRESKKGEPVGFVDAEAIFAVSPDGRVVALTRQTSPYHGAKGLDSAGMEDRFEHQVSLVNLESGLIISLPGANGSIRHLSFSPDGNSLIAAGGKVVWGRGTDKKYSQWGGDRVWVWQGLQKAWLPDAPRPTLGTEYVHGKKVKTDNPKIEDIRWAPDSKSLFECWARHGGKAVQGGKKGGVVSPVSLGLSYPANPGSLREIAEGPFHQVAWSPKGGRIAASESDAKTVRIWAPDGLQLRSMTTEDAMIAHPIFRSENEMLFVGKRTGEGASVTISRFDLQNLKVTRPEEFLRFALPNSLHQVAVATAGERLATLAGASSNEVAVIDLQAGAQVQPLTAAMPLTPYVAFSKSGYKLAWTGPDQMKLVAGVNLRTAESLAQTELTATEFGPPASTASSGDYQAVPQFSRGGLIDIVHQGRAEKKAKKGPTAKRLAFTLFAGNPDWVITTPEGYYAATPGGERLVGWHVNNGLGALATLYPLDRFRKKLYRPDVIALVLEKGSVATALKVANTLRGPEDIVGVENLLPPHCRVELMSHEKGKVTLKIRANAQAKGQPVVGLRLLLDGRQFPAEGARGAARDDGDTSADFPDGKPTVDVTWTFDLPGEKAVGAYQISVLARSPDAAAPSNTVSVSFVDPTKVPAMHVLTVGINKYADPALELRFAVKDATELAQAFQGHAKDGLFSAVHVHTLADKEATSQAILDRINEVRKTAKRNDLFILFFAGHGAKEKEQFYLLTVDADVKSLATSALSGAKLRKEIGGFPCQVLLILDACHSAGFGEKGTLKAMQLAPATDDATRVLTEDDAGVAVMVAAMGHESALEKDGNGLFTRALLEALRRAEGVPFNRSNHLLYTHHLQTFVFDRVNEQSGGRQHPYLNLPWVVQSFPVVRIAPK